MRRRRRPTGSVWAALLGAALVVAVHAPVHAENDPDERIGPTGGAAASGAQAAQTWIVGMGDSYMSGEGGVWSNKGYPSSSPSGTWSHWVTGVPDPSGEGFYSGFVYGAAGDYQSASAAERIPFAHQSAWAAPRDVGNGMTSHLTAVSGAQTNSFVKTDGGITYYKPGVNFVAAGPYPGQAAALQDFAANHDVDVVALSIGGNDFGFAPLATSCVEDWLIPIIHRYCSEQQKNLDLISPSALATLTDKVKGAIANVVTAMRAAGHADGSWRLQYQLPPMPISPSSDIPWADTGNYDRQDYGGCGMYDKDIDWIYSTVFPKLTAALSAAVEQSRGTLNGTPVVILDNGSAFDGHRLCEDPAATQAVDYPGGVAPDSPGDAATIARWGPDNGENTEWITPIILEANIPILKDPHLSQNALHPNYWGQRALSACHDAALASAADTIMTCVRANGGGLDSKDRPAMTAGSVTPIPFTHPQAPTVTGAEAGDSSLAITITAPSDQGSSAITGYEYSTHADRVPFGEGLWVPIPGGADPGRFIVTGDSDGAALVNGQEYSVVIRAVNAAGTGPASDSVSATPVGPPDAPGTPQAAAGDRQVMLAWQEPSSDGGSPITGYRIQQRAAGGAWETAVTNTSETSARHTITGLTNGTGYEFRVAGVNATGVGPWSEASAAVVPGGQVGQAGQAGTSSPASLVAVGGGSIGPALLGGAVLLALGGGLLAAVGRNRTARR